MFLKFCWNSGKPLADAFDYSSGVKLVDSSRPSRSNQWKDELSKVPPVIDESCSASSARSKSPSRRTKVAKMWRDSER
jgi:hypothetical protein